MVCPAHINCICPDIQKIPKRKLRYIREQRLRGGGGNSGFIHPLKINPNKKLKVENSDAGMNDESDNDPSDPSDTPYINERPTTAIYHPLTALAIMRHPDQSFRAASEIIAAYCMDKGYVSKEDTGDILDHVNLWREVQQVGHQLNESADSAAVQRGCCSDGSKVSRVARPLRHTVHPSVHLTTEDSPQRPPTIQLCLSSLLSSLP